MDQALRNKLRAAVTQCRRLLEEAVAQVLQGQFGVYATGRKDEVQVEDAARMGHLSEEDRGYRDQILVHLDHIQATGFKLQEKPTAPALQQLVREVAFTHLNRLCAYKMMETRGLVRESVGRVLKSQGFLFYLADHEDDERFHQSGQQDVAYRHFLRWLGGTLSEEVGVLFSPHDPANRLFPPQRVLEEVLALINGEDLKGIWGEDEAIGWVYQYFTPKELRDQARKESAAPRNSYELAFRNQFFTPRYVVEFLTDNTLGRIWYEMRKGDTTLRDRCRYLVRRPCEVFLKQGESPPADAPVKDDLPQDELLKQPVHVPHRPKKDPREIKALDPACGSGHFLLYCYDLLLVIYEEAYADPDLGPALKKDYPTLEDLRKALPGLILSHNLHGIDIDRRATQIAALALWLRALRAWSEMGVKKDRPKITRTNIVCAEPMPGENDLLEEFLKTLGEERLEGLIRRVLHLPAEKRLRATHSMADSLCGLVRLVWDRMRLAGEAGSLLKIEEDLQTAIRQGQKEWEEDQPLFRVTEFSLMEEPSEHLYRFVPGDIEGERISFWDIAERLVLAALQDYARQATNGKGFQRQLFAGDAERGFAFVDVCRQKFDVALMNPPFGGASKPSKGYVEKSYPRTKNDVYSAFVERMLGVLQPGGMVGVITSRSGFFLTSFQKWREEILLPSTQPTVFADLGNGVLDTAMVETAAYCLRAGCSPNYPASFVRLLATADKEAGIKEAVEKLLAGQVSANVFTIDPGTFGQVPGSPFAYWISDRVRRLFKDLPRLEAEGRKAQKGAYTNDDFRFLRVWWEVAAVTAARKREETLTGKRWAALAKGGAYSPYFSDWEMVIDWLNDGEALKAFLSEYRGSRGWGYQWSAALNGYSFYFRPGVSWARRTQRGFNVRALPAGCIIGDKGPSLFLEKDDHNELLFFAGLMNSLAFKFLLDLQTSFGSFEVGVLEQTPVPMSSRRELQERLQALSRNIIDAKREIDGYSEISHGFRYPALLQSPPQSLTDGCKAWVARQDEIEQRVAQYQGQVDDVAFQAYGIEGVDKQAIRQSLEKPMVAEEDSGDAGDVDTEDNGGSGAEPRSAVAPLLSYAVGCVFGRWDVRLGTGERHSPERPDPFAPLPVCSPGMLTGSDGLPVKEVSSGYPLRVEWDGIMVDDPDHPSDILRRVREVLELLWKDRTEAIEREACEILGVKELRDYFRKPASGGFWDDHVKRYSKSRRKAPIYWLLQSGKKNYALWLYYHRLDRDILFKALVNYVEPKVRLEDDRLTGLRTRRAGASGREVKNLDRQIEKQEAFLSELRDFEDKLRRAANLHLVPDLNDGVVLNIAPLWELVPWKEAKAYRDELWAGEYEWSSIGKQLREKRLVQ